MPDEAGRGGEEGREGSRAGAPDFPQDAARRYAAVGRMGETVSTPDLSKRGASPYLQGNSRVPSTGRPLERTLPRTFRPPEKTVAGRSRRDRPVALTLLRGCGKLRPLKRGHLNLFRGGAHGQDP